MTRGVLLLVVALLAADAPAQRPALLVDEFTTWTKLAASPVMKLPKAQAWREHVPAVQWVGIPASADDSTQEALFYDSGSARKKPLLLVLHSWSEDFEQHYGIPYGVFAAANDWVFLHPNFRGEFDDPQATASELAVSDVLDALAWAKERSNIDDDRIYLVGFSGGGMMSLVLAGRYPELWTAVLAWVPVFDLEAWYGEVRRRYRHYAREIRASCGGAPVGDSEAARECRRRSPAAYLEGARGKDVRIYIATGIDDPFVSPVHSLRAFNVLAEPQDRFTPAEMSAIAKQRRPPADAGAVHDPLYEAAGRPILLERQSANVRLRVFKGRHDVIYNAGLAWLSLQSRT